MRNLINMVEGAGINLDALFRSVAAHFERQEQYFFEGDCLNFAVAMHQVLNEHGISNDILAVMRTDDEDKEVLSHFVNEIAGETYDSQGSQAVEQWEIDFNHIRRINNEAEEEFWTETVSAPLPEYIDSINLAHGDDTKLVNKPKLRAEIIEVAQQLLS